MCGVRWVACSLLWPDLRRLALDAYSPPRTTSTTTTTAAAADLSRRRRLRLGRHVVDDGPALLPQLLVVGVAQPVAVLQVRELRLVQVALLGLHSVGHNAVVVPGSE